MVHVVVKKKALYCFCSIYNFSDLTRPEAIKSNITISLCGQKPLSNTLQFFSVEMFIVCTNFSVLIESIFLNNKKGNTPWEDILTQIRCGEHMQLSVRTFTLVNPAIEEIIPLTSLHCLDDMQYPVCPVEGNISLE